MLPDRSLQSPGLTIHLIHHIRVLDVQGVFALLHAGADPSHFCDRINMTPLDAMLDVFKNHPKEGLQIACALIAAGADVNQDRGVSKPGIYLSAALSEFSFLKMDKSDEYWKLIELFIKAGADVNADPYPCGTSMTPLERITARIEIINQRIWMDEYKPIAAKAIAARNLMIQSSGEKLEYTRPSIEAFTPDLNAVVNTKGYNNLHTAAYCCDPDGVTLALRTYTIRRCPTARTEGGLTALHLAVLAARDPQKRDNAIKVIERIVNAWKILKVPVDTHGFDDESALNFALLFNNPDHDLCDYLVKMGASPTDEDDERHTPLERVQQELGVVCHQHTTHPKLMMACSLFGWRTLGQRLATQTWRQHCPELLKLAEDMEAALQSQSRSTAKRISTA